MPRKEARRIVRVRWQVGIVGVAVGQMAERDENIIAIIAADRAKDIARLAGDCIQALHEGEIAVACGTQERVEVGAGMFGDSHCCSPETGKPGATAGLD